MKRDKQEEILTKALDLILEVQTACHHNAYCKTEGLESTPFERELEQAYMALMGCLDNEFSITWKES